MDGSNTILIYYFGNARYMRIIVLGGFLGSGKTTILMKIANTFIAKGRKVAVLVNDVGEIGVDGKTLAAEGYNTTELPDGCVCCSLKSTLQIAVNNIARDVNPDVMLIEPTGLALPSKVVESIVTIHEVLPDAPKFPKPDIIGVVDAVRFPIFAAKKETFVKEQTEGSKMVIINKIDVASEKCMADTEMWLSLNVGDVPLYKVSALTGEGMDKAMEAIIDE